MNELTLLPSSVESERATLGSVLLNRDGISVIEPWLKPDQFYLEQNAWIYEAMLACYRRRQPPSTTMVVEELRRTNRLEAIGGISTLTDLAASCPTSEYIEHYARMVEKAAILRNIISAGGNIAQIAYSHPEDADQAIADCFAELEKATKRASSGGFSQIGEVFSGIYQRMSRNELSLGIPTGFRDLDEMMKGLQPSDLIILAARPSVGKTAFAMMLAYNIGYKTRAHVGLFSLEMNKDQLAYRLISIDTKVSSQRIRTGDLKDSETQAIIDSMGRMADSPIFIEDSSGLTLSQVRQKALRLQAEVGIDILIIDYLQLMSGSGSGSRKSENRVNEVSEISRGLKTLAREMNIPIIVLSQLSRAVEGRQSHIPMLSDLRDSGAIEQDADIVMFIYREELYEKDTDRKGIAEIHVSKHRNGPVGVVDLHFDTETTCFNDVTYRDFDQFDPKQPPRYAAALEDDLFGGNND